MPRGDFARWLYPGGRPNQLARFLNWVWAVLHAAGIAPNYLVTLEVAARKSGRMTSLPLVVAVVGGRRYLVSMHGENAAWVRNARAAAGKVVLRHGHREEVHLEEVPTAERAPILKAFLAAAPGARPHIPVDKDAPLLEFEKLASTFPVFRVVSVETKDRN